MCGICGLVYYGDKIPNRIIEYQFKNIFAELFKASMVRGTDASGIIVLKEDKIYTYKDRLPADKLLDEKEVKEIFATIEMGTKTKAILGHTRSQTKGSARYNVNNHPIIAGTIVGIHNGIISNDEVLFETNPNLKRRGQVDSEIIFRLIDEYRSMGKSLIDSVRFTATRVVGSMAGAFICSTNPRYIVLFRDISYASLVVRIYKSEQIIAFASTPSILDAINNYTLLTQSKCTGEIMMNNTILRIDVATGKIFKTTLVR